MHIGMLTDKLQTFGVLYQDLSTFRRENFSWEWYPIIWHDELDSSLVPCF